MNPDLPISPGKIIIVAAWLAAMAIGPDVGRYADDWLDGGKDRLRPFAWGLAAAWFVVAVAALHTVNWTYR